MTRHVLATVLYEELVALGDSESLVIRQRWVREPAQGGVASGV